MKFWLVSSEFGGRCLSANQLSNEEVCRAAAAAVAVARARCVFRGHRRRQGGKSCRKPSICAKSVEGDAKAEMKERMKLHRILCR